MKPYFFFFFLCQLISGQSFEGKVLDYETRAPLENVHVYLLNSARGTITNHVGEYSITTTDNTHLSDTLQFSIIGYATLKISFSMLQDSGFQTLLTRQNEKLDPIKLNSQTKLNSSLKFTKMAPLDLGVYSFGSIIIGDQIYVLGGDASFLEDTFSEAVDKVGALMEPKFEDIQKKWRQNLSWEHYSDKLQIYNIETNQWKSSDIEFNNRAYHNIHSYKNSLFTLGGKRISKNKKFQYLEHTIEVLNLNTNELLIDKTNPHQSVNFASFSYKDNIILMGGSTKIKSNNEKIYSYKSHYFNITSGVWYELPNMIKAKETKGVIIGDKIFIIGGFNKTPISNIESFNLISGKWKKEGELFYGIKNPALAVRYDVIYIFDYGKLFTFNSNTGVLNAYNINIQVNESQLLCHQNNLYIIGGYIENEFTKKPSTGVYKINLAEIESTKIIQSNKIN